MSDSLPDLYQRALDFAEKAHAGQLRITGVAGVTGPEGETEPYFEHCRRVAAMVWDLTHAPELAAVAALHDVLEDSETTFDSLKEGFSESIAFRVRTLSVQFVPAPGWNREARKEAEANRYGCLPWRTRLIKLCDCIDNARSIEAKGGDFVAVWRSELAYLLPLLLGAPMPKIPKCSSKTCDLEAECLDPAGEPWCLHDQFRSDHALTDEGWVFPKAWQ